LSGLAALVAIWAGWHRPVWLALRLVLIAAISFVAMGPQRVEAEHEYLNDIALLLVDKTLSMQMGQRAAIGQQAAAQVRAFADENPDLDLLEVQVADSPDGSRIFESLQTGLAQIPADRLAGVVMLTDGISHDQLPALTVSAPIHVLLSGDPQQGDRSLQIIEAPRFGIVGQQVKFKIRVDDFGQDSRSNAPITLQVAGQPPMQVNVQTGVDVTVGLPLTRRGSNLVEIRAGAAGEELTLRNNRIAVDVTGVRERLRVLLVSGEPYAGVRAWRNLLKSDPAVDLVHFTILRPPTKRDPTPLNEMALIAFPTRELFVEKLDSFDLVIFDSYTRRGVLPLIYLENIARYVENGGALMVAAGPPFAGQGSLAKTFLASILPARPDDNISNAPFTPTITKTGQRHPVTNSLADLQDNWGRWGRVIGVTGVTGDTVLSAADDTPLLILDRVKQGRVALLLSDQAWLWSRGFEGGGPQYELYRRLAHWLMKEPELEEEALSGKIIDGQLQVKLQTLLDVPTPVEIETADGQISRLTLQQVSPGVFSATLPVAANSGILTLKSGELLSVAAQGQLNLPELNDLAINTSFAAGFAKSNKGAQLALSNTSAKFSLRRTRPQDRQAGRNWLGLQKNRVSIQTNSSKKPLFAAWLGLLVLLVLSALMWLREGRA
ncbi:FIG003492: Threonine dehydrogenase and related Zn-dependent dehydrogenases, partial [hydrothermal vent metagenome]